MLLLAVLAIAYAPSFSGAWHYDDYPNIIENPHVHLETISGSTIRQTFYWQDGRPGAAPQLQRPLSYFSFALNWYVGRDQAIGYHAANFAIHYVTAIFLYWVVRLLLSLPAAGWRDLRMVHAVACLTAVIWAVHPVQVTAVTYIVQRMASMAGMFTMMSIFFYLRARINPGPAWQRGLQGVLGVLCALLALASKENSAMLPISILTLELLILQRGQMRSVRRTAVPIVVAVAMFAAIGLVLIDPSTLLAGYHKRPYAPMERVLTEARVIMFYVRLLFYPLLSGFTLVHDFNISTSLWSPWTTLASIAALAGSTLGSLLWLAKRYPWAAFAVLFFLINHAIEASFIPLELIYEHRNYIPSMFVFLFPATLIVRSLDYFAYHRSLQMLIVLSGAIVLASIAHTTYAYNHKFGDSLRLWRDNAEKSPRLSIVHNNHGVALMHYGLYGQAYHAFMRAIQHDRYFNHTQRGLAHYNLGFYYETVAGDDAVALKFYREAIQRAYSDRRMGVALAMSYLRNGHVERAVALIHDGLLQWPNDPDFLTAQATAHILRREWTSALNTTHRIRRLDPQAVEPLGLYGEIYNHLGEPHKAISFWQQYGRQSGRQWVADLALIDLYARTGQSQQRQQAASRLAREERRNRVGKGSHPTLLTPAWRLDTALR